MTSRVFLKPLLHSDSFLRTFLFNVLHYFLLITRLFVIAWQDLRILRTYVLIMDKIIFYVLSNLSRFGFRYCCHFSVITITVFLPDLNSYIYVSCGGINNNG